MKHYLKSNRSTQKRLFDWKYFVKFRETAIAFCIFTASGNEEKIFNLILYNENFE